MPATSEPEHTLTRNLCLDGPLVAEMVRYGVSMTEAARMIKGALAVRYLREANGNLSAAARLAGEHRNTFLRWIPRDLRKEHKEQGRNVRRAKVKLAEVKDALIRSRPNSASRNW